MINIMLVNQVTYPEGTTDVMIRADIKRRVVDFEAAYEALKISYEKTSDSGALFYGTFAGTELELMGLAANYGFKGFDTNMDDDYEPPVPPPGYQRLKKERSVAKKKDNSGEIPVIDDGSNVLRLIQQYNESILNSLRRYPKVRIKFPEEKKGKMDWPPGAVHRHVPKVVHYKRQTALTEAQLMASDLVFPRQILFLGYDYKGDVDPNCPEYDPKAMDVSLYNGEIHIEFVKEA